MKKRVFSVITALALCLTLLPTAAWAAETDEEPDEQPGTAVWTVTAFDDLGEDVAHQTLPQLAEDGEDKGPNLPDTLGTTAYQGADEPQAVDIAVTWAAEPNFDPTAPGDYVYTPALPEGYALAEDVALPTITVTVEAAPPQDAPDEQLSTAVWTVTAFDDLGEDVTRQTLPQLAEDGEDKGPNLPETLNATAYQVEDDAQPIIIEMTWAAEPDFDPATPGEYVYTPALPEGYALAEDVELPAITVTVEAAPPQDAPDETPTEGELVAYDTGDSDTAVNWADETDTSWYNTSDTTFTISTAAELAGLASLVNNGNRFSGKTITLVADIDLENKEWTPIGSGGDGINQFRGTFDGNGKTVSNLYVSVSSENVGIYAGLFGYVRDGTVKKLNVSGEVTVTVTSSNYVTIYVGSVVGYAYNTTVENCSFSGAVSGIGTGSANPYVGGVVGRAYSSAGITTVKNCSHSGTVMANSDGSSQAGGVVGNVGVYSSGQVTVENCFSSGAVSGSGTNVWVGGVVAYNGSKGTVTNCYHTGNVSGKPNGSGSPDSFYVGGVVGYAYENKGTTAVENCYFLQGTDTNADLSGISNASTATGAVSKTAEDFASGAVAYLLSGGENQAETNPWRQNLESYLPEGSTAADAYPTLDSTHLRVTQASGSERYTNTLGELTSEDDAYEIANAAQLYAFAQKVNSGKTSINAKLMDDIDLSSVCGENLNGGTSWTPIGNSSNSFKGTFDGQGHTVKGLYMNITRNDNYSTYGGLFGDMRGTVKNLNVNGTVTVTNEGSNFVYVGGVVGYADGASGALSTVENCSFTGEVTGTGYSIYVGGVVGPADKATVRGCSNSGTVTVNGQNYSRAGGVVGRAYNGTTVENCYNTGTVTGTGSGTFYVGGVAGYIYLTTTMENCYNTGTVSGPSGGNVGGVVGGAGYAANYPSTVENCYFLQTDEVNDGLSGIGCDETSSSASNTGAEGKDSAAFASGEVAYLLQGEQTGTDKVWVQVKGSDGSSTTYYPTLYALLSEEERAQICTVYVVTFTAGDNTEYRYAVEGGTVAVPAVPADYSNWYTDENQVFTSSTTVTKNLTVTAKKQAGTPSVAIDYENETLTGFASGAAYTIDGTVVTPNSDNTLPVTDYMGQTVSIVRKGADGSVDSAPQSLPIPARPSAPTGVRGENETVDGKADGKITGVTTAMEYKLSTADTWMACTDTAVTGLAPGEYQVRLAATNASFASAAEDVRIGTGAERTYTLHVTAPTFASVAYGYTQPAAQSITISNSGNSVSAISGVALRGDTNAFALNKTDGATVQPGGTDTTYAIQPAANLDAGTYTATITVTYQDGETATATVSFTVTQADQDAPTAAPAAAGKTYHSVTLETVEKNTNGAAAEYGISEDGGENWTWQDSPEFAGLSASTTYTFSVRYGAVDNYAVSEPGPTAEIATFSRSSGGGSSTPTYTPTVERADNGSATVSPKNPSQGDKVTITLKPDTGYEVDSVTVTDKNGKTVKVTDNGDGTYSFIQPAGKVTVEVTFTEIEQPVENLSFIDIPESAYYYDAVKWAVENGVTTGTTAATFSPDTSCTRAQAVTFLWRAAGSPEPVNADCPFTDLQPDDYYYKAVLWAVENGITAGTSANTFSPNAPCTRGQIVTFLYRAEGTAVAGSNPFADVADSAYYAGAVKWAVAEGVTAGTTSTTFSPDDPCTRAQIVTFLYRVYG